MLDSLAKYAGCKGLDAEPGFAPKTVRWAIQCTDEGHFQGVIRIGNVDNPKDPGLKFLKCPEFSQPEMKAGGVTKSHFLVETVEVAALSGPKAEDSKVIEKHRYFIDLLKQSGKSVPELAHLANLLTDPQSMEAIRNDLQIHNIKPAEKITFLIGDRFPVESDSWHDWWRDFRNHMHHQNKKKTSSEKRMRCLISGQLVPPAKTHPKITGLTDVGGLSMGDVLVGFKQDSFRSYGLEQSMNAAVSEQAASTYRAALNHLIHNQSRRLVGAKVVYWFSKEVMPEENPLFFLEMGQEHIETEAVADVRKLLAAVDSGEKPYLQNNMYHVLTLSGAGGRVMVRDWIEGQFEELVRNISTWFDDLAIVHRKGGGMAPLPKFLAVIGATVRDLKEASPPFVAKMWRVAVKDEPVPRSALAQALMRIRIEFLRNEVPNHARIGLLKAYHVRKNRQYGGDMMNEDVKPYLNPEHPSPAYQCGRLMAVFASLQYRAMGDVGAGVVQRYYAAASTTPALVLGRLTRTSQFHLNKLRRPKLARWYENRLAGIWSRLNDGLPRTLHLEDQSLFALGYYQELADLRTKKTKEPIEAEEE